MRSYQVIEKYGEMISYYEFLRFVSENYPEQHEAIAKEFSGDHLVYAMLNIMEYRDKDMFDKFVEYMEKNWKGGEK